MVEELLTATGKTNENGAVNFILAPPRRADPGRQGGPRKATFDAVPITSRVTRLFLGLQTQCTQCHDHPFNPEWKQDGLLGRERLLPPGDARPARRRRRHEPQQMQDGRRPSSTLQRRRRR